MKRGREEESAGAEKKLKKGEKKVLLLGCGLVAPPLIHYLTNHNIHLTIASRTVQKIKEVVQNIDPTLVTPIACDVEREEDWEIVDRLTQPVDLVISLLPYLHHVRAAKIALKYKKHFCTTSYTSDEMSALDQEAKDAGVILLNECGVDPGLDHMSAQKVIDKVHEQKGKIIGFTSICGGLPAPQHNNNPLGYKLSWSPRGVLLASRNDATFLVNGKLERVPGKNLYDKKTFKVDQVEDQKLEWYPNRDSTKYIDIYSIPEVKTIIRGTYRNAGWCDFMRVVSSYGFTSTDRVELEGKTFAEFTAGLLRTSETEGKNPRALLCSRVGLEDNDPVVAKFEWLGLFSEELKIPASISTPLDAVCYLFQRSMVYAPGEKDMLVMRHTFEVEYSAAKRETLTSTMLDFGLQPDGFSSMSRTVSLPVAAAIRAILDGRLSLTGIVRPVKPEVYNLVLDEMKAQNIVFNEKRLAPLLWVRSETKPGEERVAITPADAKRLLEKGYRVKVERSPTRCFADEEYAKAGCDLVPGESWQTAPHSAIILGLKELPEEKFPLEHRHIYFAHCYKKQTGWKDVLTRFKQGGGLLWDIEFLVDENKRRVAAFGRPAGVVGMALALQQWARQKTPPHTNISNLKSWKTTADMVADVKAELDKVDAKPKVLVLGALGRCGGGACWFAEQCGLTPTRWDLAETKKGGPFPELLQQDVLVNAIYLSEKIPPFITPDMIKESKDRRLSVFSDVSCDFTNPNNPFPIYDRGTNLVDPLLHIVPGDSKTGQLPLDVISIDHLPSLTPADSSTAFSADLFPHLANLLESVDHPVWKRAEDLYYEKVALVD